MSKVLRVRFKNVRPITRFQPPSKKNGVAIARAAARRYAMDDIFRSIRDYHRSGDAAWKASKTILEEHLDPRLPVEIRRKRLLNAGVREEAVDKLVIQLVAVSDI